MSFSFVRGASGVGSATIDTSTGSVKLLCIVCGMDGGATISNNQGDTASPLTQIIGTDGPGSPNANATRIWWIKAPTSAVSYTVTNSLSYACVTILAFTSDQLAANIVLDGQATGAAVVNGTSLQVGSSYTPTGGNALLISGVSLGGNASSPAITGGFTVGSSRNGVASVSYGSGAAYLVQTLPVSAQPTWSWSNTASCATVMAAFRDGSSPPAATDVTLTGPTSGPVSAPSSNFTVSANGSITGTVTVTPNDAGGGGSFTPASVTINNAAPTATFTYTAASSGAKTISVTNSGGLANPVGITYTASSPATLTGATVADNGASIALTFGATTTLSAANVSITADGYSVPCTAVTGSGSSWSAFIGLRWIRASTSVQVTVSGTTVTATNNSVITNEKVAHVGRKFGMFVHFGINTFNNVEWSDGSLAANTFAPSGSMSAGMDSWIAGAKAAGMRYMVLTTKHHDGFALWPTAEGGYNISNSSWWAGAGSPDLVGMFVQKCRAANLGVGLYFSVWDRKWEASNPGYTGAQYVAHCQNHLTDLLTKYGPIDLLWFDGWNWVDALAAGQPNFGTIPFASLYDHCKGLQPKCQVIVNNHAGSLSTSDVVEFEIGTTGGTGPGSSNLYPAETCDTIRADHNWFWKTAADAGLSAATISSTLATLNSYRSGYLLNCPPSTTGALPAATHATLAVVGSTVLEEGLGVTAAASYVKRTLSVTIPGAAGLTGKVAAFYEETKPNLHRAPAAWLKLDFDGSGVASTSVYTKLGSGGVGFLVVGDWDGTTSQTPQDGWAGPVAVS